SRVNEEGPRRRGGALSQWRRRPARSIRRDDDAPGEGKEGPQGGIVGPERREGVGGHPHGAGGPQHPATAGGGSAQMVLVNVVVVPEEAPVGVGPSRERVAPAHVVVTGLRLDGDRPAEVFTGRA